MNEKKLINGKTTAKCVMVCVAIVCMCWYDGTTCRAHTPSADPSALPPDLQEVVKLSQQKMNDEIIVNYIKNSGKAYKLSAADITSLSTQGVSQGVISALLSASSGGSPADQYLPAAAQATIPRNENGGTGGTLRITSGSGDFNSLSSANKTLTVGQGAKLNGTIELQALNLGVADAIAPLIWTPSWGDHSTSWRLVDAWVHTGESAQHAQVSFTAPTTPGVYHIIFAFGWEIGGDHVASGSNWGLHSNVWNDGNDIAEFNASQISSAQLKGYAVDRWLFGGPNGTTHDEQQYTPSDAITLIVEADGSTTAIGSQAEPMTAPALVSQQPPPLNAAPPAPAQGPEINFDYFHNQLAPFGTWVDVGGGTMYWHPDEAIAANPDWRPYYDMGHWVHTENGLFWQSDYTWGDIPFHYGRWVLDPVRGWLWAPDFTWGPAWVFWRHAEVDASIGWAPLRVGAVFVDGVFMFNGAAVAADFDFGLGEGFFVFAGFDHFHDSFFRMRGHEYAFHVPRERAGEFYRRSVVRNDFRKMSTVDLSTRESVETASNA